MIEVNFEALALAHPLRAAMLDVMAREASSASSLAETMSVSPSRASYHLFVLKNAGLVEEVDAEAAGGPAGPLYRGA